MYKNIFTMAQLRFRPGLWGVGSVGLDVLGLMGALGFVWPGLGFASPWAVGSRPVGPRCAGVGRVCWVPFTQDSASHRPGLWGVGPLGLDVLWLMGALGFVYPGLGFASPWAVGNRPVGPRCAWK